jgi:hypothetical protein
MPRPRTHEGTQTEDVSYGSLCTSADWEERGTHHHSLIQNGHTVALFQNPWEFRSLGTAIITSHCISQSFNKDLLHSTTVEIVL